MTESVPFIVAYSELASLGDGWLDGEGEAPAVEVLAVVRATMDLLYAAETPHRDLARLRIFPTPNAGVQFEWTVESTEKSLEVRRDLKAYHVALDTTTGVFVEREYEVFDRPTILCELLS